MRFAAVARAAAERNSRDRLSFLNAYFATRERARARSALYNPRNVEHDNPLLDPRSPTPVPGRISPGVDSHSLSSPRGTRACTYIASIHAERRIFRLRRGAGCGFPGLQSAAITRSLPGKPRRDDLRPLGNVCCHGGCW